MTVCPFCKKFDGKEIEMKEIGDKISCDRCNSSIYLRDRPPIPRLVKEWGDNAESMEGIIRPHLYQDDLPIPRIFTLYEDCYHAMLIGRYNTAIVMMGVLLEALMKELIELKTEGSMPNSYGGCVNTIKDRKLMHRDDIDFLEKFKDSIRNLYQHSKETEIVGHGYVSVWPIKISKENAAETIKTELDKIRAGKIKPVPMLATNPVVCTSVKWGMDKNKAIGLFNEVYDFVLKCNTKYFKPEVYEEARKRFGRP